MQSRWMRRLGLGALIGALTWASVGCAGERDPINRVQPNAMPKSFFVGSLTDSKDDPEFYMRNTVVDVPYGAAQDGLFTASYAQPTNRIKWEVQENALIARETFERITNSDGKGSKTTNDGQVVAMFAIQSHFDIRRDYNPGTGEESNTIVENTSDRPWYQREFMRVDWSKNLVTDGYNVDTLSQLGLFGGVKFDPLEYKVEDPNDPNAPAFAPEEGYFDVATKAFATPGMINIPGYGDIPACWLTSAGRQANCNATELTLRLSFRKVVETDYEPSEWDGNRQDTFGAFYSERYGYERNYGLLDDQWHRLAAKYNMFERSHISSDVGGKEMFAQCAVDYWRDEFGQVAKFKVKADGTPERDAKGFPIPDPNGKPVAISSVANAQNRSKDRWRSLDTNENGTDDECEAYGVQGSRCDVLAKRCTLPLHKRTTKTIPWYYGSDGPADLYPSTAAALEQWNVAAKQALQAGMKVDASRFGGNPDQYITDEGAIARREGNAAALKDVFVLCHSPVLDTDDKACGKPGTVARVGDLRYNSVNIINTPQDPSPWGIMVDGDDPLTGEKVNTSVNEWGHVLDLASQGTFDYLRWLNGEITDEQVSSGEYMNEWVRSNAQGRAGFEAKTLSKAEVQQRIDSVLSSDGNGKATRPTLPVGVEVPAAKRADIMKAIKTRVPSTERVPDRNPEIEARRLQFVGSKFETMLATKEMQVAGGMDPRTAGSVINDDAALARVSPLRALNPQVQKWVQRQKDIHAHEHASCMIEQPEPTAQIGLARQAAKLYPLPDANDANYPALKAKRDRDAFQWIREQFHISVILHEMGHSMGLRHNFVGNFDALNFHTQYWQLRTRNGKEKACTSLDPQTDGSKCVGGRWFDPITDAEQDGLLAKWGASTVMDYPGDTAQDMNGLGKYDKAWMRFMYSNVIDVDTEDTPAIAKRKLTDYPEIASRNSGGVLGLFGADPYWTINDNYNVLGSCEDGEGLAAKCTGVKLDYRSVFTATDKSGANYAISDDGLPRHPYMFSSDEFADGGNVLVYRHDAGADLYEQAQYFISSYENRYIFDNFRRNRTNFSVGGTVNRTLSRYFDKMTATTKALGLGRGFFERNPSDLAIVLSRPEYMLEHALASSLGFEEFIKILTRPEPGEYSFAQTQDYGSDTCATKSYAEVGGQQPCIPSTQNRPTPIDFTLSVGQGGSRYLHNEYDYSKGYEWSSYLKWVGSYYEKTYVTFFLQEAYNNFLQNSKDDYIDGRDRNINYSTIYPEQMRRLVAAMMQNDATTYAPYIMPGQTAAKANPIEWLPLDRYVAGDPATTAPNYPAGAVRLSPLVGWEQQFPAIIYNYIYGATTLTMNWNNMMRVWYPESDGALPVPANEQVIFRDPFTGVRYAARSFGTETLAGRIVQRGPGSRMIQYANSYAKAAFKTIGAADPVTGELTYERDEAGQPKCTFAADSVQCFDARKRMKYFSSNLDTVREISMYIQSPLSSR